MKKTNAIIGTAVLALTGLAFGLEVNCELTNTKEDYVSCKQGLTGAEKGIVNAALTAEAIEVAGQDIETLKQTIESTMRKLDDDFADCTIINNVFRCEENNVLLRIENRSNAIYANKMIK